MPESVVAREGAWGGRFQRSRYNLRLATIGVGPVKYQRVRAVHLQIAAAADDAVVGLGGGIGKCQRRAVANDNIAGDRAVVEDAVAQLQPAVFFYCRIAGVCVLSVRVVFSEDVSPPGPVRSAPIVAWSAR